MPSIAVEEEEAEAATADSPRRKKDKGGKGLKNRLSIFGRNKSKAPAPKAAEKAPEVPLEDDFE